MIPSPNSNQLQQFNCIPQTQGHLIPNITVNSNPSINMKLKPMVTMPTMPTMPAMPTPIIPTTSTMPTMPMMPRMPAMPPMPVIPATPGIAPGLVISKSPSCSPDLSELLNNSANSSMWYNLINEDMLNSSFNLDINASASPAPIDNLNTTPHNLNVPQPTFNFPQVNTPNTTNLLNQNVNTITIPIPKTQQIAIPSSTATPKAQPGVQFRVSPTTNTSTIESSNKPMTHQEAQNAATFLTGQYLSMYYNALNQNKLEEIKAWYHANAEIERSCLFDRVNGEEANNISNNMSQEHKLNLLQNKIVSVAIKSSIAQKSVSNAMLIRVSGIMEYMDDINKVSLKSFEQIFIVKKENGAWLIVNDILSFPLSQNSRVSNINRQTEEQKISTNRAAPKQLFQDDTITTSIDSNSNSTISMNSRKENLNVNINVNRPKMPKFESPLKRTYNTSIAANYRNDKYHRGHNNNMVNSQLVNRFYQDASYQNYDNNLAIFIRRIPKNVTQIQLENILKSCLIRYCENSGINHIDNISIEYVDVNYHKKYAFVYLGNIETYSIALEMGYITIGRINCQIEQKRSGNGPRKGPIIKTQNRGSHYNTPIRATHELDFEYDNY